MWRVVCYRLEYKICGREIVHTSVSHAPALQAVGRWLTLLKQQPTWWRTKKMGIIIALIMGLIIGALAKAIMPGRDPGGIIITILLGIAGSLIGSVLAGVLGLGRANGANTSITDFNIWSIILGVIGAIILLAVYRMIAGRRTVA